LDSVYYTKEINSPLSLSPPFYFLSKEHYYASMTLPAATFTITTQVKRKEKETLSPDITSARQHKGKLTKYQGILETNYGNTQLIKSEPTSNTSPPKVSHCPIKTNHLLTRQQATDLCHSTPHPKSLSPFTTHSISFPFVLFPQVELNVAARAQRRLTHQENKPQKLKTFHPGLVRSIFSFPQLHAI